MGDFNFNLLIYKDKGKGAKMVTYTKEGLEKLLEDIRDFYIANGKEKFVDHVNIVGDISREIAKTYSLDEAKCLLGAIVHDISAVIPKEDLYEKAKENGLEILQCEEEFPFLLHQKLSKLMAEKIFKIEDEDVLLAIECHTSLKANPSEYDMALFIADKLQRHNLGKPSYYDGVYELIKKREELGLEKAVNIIFNHYEENDSVIHPHKWYLEAKDYIKSKLS